MKSLRLKKIEYYISDNYSYYDIINAQRDLQLNKDPCFIVLSKKSNMLTKCGWYYGWNTS